MPVNPAESIALLKTLWPSTTTGWGELRLLCAEGAKRPLFLKVPLETAHLYPALEWAANRNAQGCNVYFGCHVRDKQRGLNDSVPVFRCLIADLDNIDASWPKVQRLHEAGCPASIMVKTHRGVHLYWLLQEPEDSTGVARQRMQLLQKALGSDMVHDPARILRLPGYQSYKDGQTLTTTISWLCPEIQYTSLQIEQYVNKLWPELKLEEPKQVTENVSLTFPPSSMPLELWNQFNQPAPKGTRSQLCLQFIQQALFHGWEVDQIFNCIMQLPIGGHYTDRAGKAESSFNYDLDKAKQNVYRAVVASMRVMIKDVSIYENPPENNIPGIRKLKLRLLPYTHKSGNSTFLEWLRIPDEWRPKPNRWFTFMRAVGLSPDTTAEELLEALPGRLLRVEFGEESVNKVRYFYKDC